MEVEAARKKTTFKNRAPNDLELVRHMRMRHVAQSRGLLHNHGVLLSGFAVADAAGAERAWVTGHMRMRHVAQSRGLLHNHDVLLSGFAVPDAAGAERAWSLGSLSEFATAGANGAVRWSSWRQGQTQGLGIKYGLGLFCCNMGEPRAQPATPARAPIDYVHLGPN